MLATFKYNIRNHSLKDLMGRLSHIRKVGLCISLMFL